MEDSPMDLALLYRTQPVVLTAHRGFSSQYPENTLPAFLKAAEAGADLIECDIRGSRERVPVILHNPTLDETSNGSGPPGAYSLEELKQFDFSYRRGGSSGECLPSDPVEIPTFEETVVTVPKWMGLNIQVKETDAPLLREVCRLFSAHDLYRRGFLTLSTFADAEKVRRVDGDIELCVLEREMTLDRSLLQRMKEFGCRFLQPHRRDVTPELCARINEMGFFAGMYFVNTEADMRTYISYGMRGMLTDEPQLLSEVRSRMNLNPG